MNILLAAINIPSPIKDKYVEDLVITIINYMLGISGLIALVFIVIGGFSYITSSGNDDQVKKATKTITYAIVGLIAIFASYAILNNVKLILK